MVFGIEGQADRRAIECYLFGINRGRIVETSATGSPQYQDETGPHELHQGRRARLFTLVGTLTMRVTRSSADQSPVCVVVCGKDQKMQQTLLCSYDWQTHTFYREKILRMQNLVLNGTDRVDSFRLSSRRTSLKHGSNEGIIPAKRIRSDTVMATDSVPEAEYTGRFLPSWW